MSIDYFSKSKLPHPGPYLAEVTNHLDTTYMGSLEVAIIKGQPTSTNDKSKTYQVRYLNPFYGVTSARFEGNNSGDFNDVQKSYGWWAVPPDVGTTVMVIFIDGDVNQGYWMGCVPDQFQNHMVPGIAASKNTAITVEQERKYGTSYLPVAEFNTKVQKLDSNRNPSSFQKPVHPFADRLLAQGLLADLVRGVTSSSARREVPSSVFGISTPGPLDDSPGSKRGKIGFDGDKTVPVSRLGGSTFVMDDGDVNGQNELVRIRTRTGHQILLHNSHDLIYIANSKGTAWIELTSNGKIDIYAEDSISIHTQNDFNFRADRDVNIEAGRNMNIKVAENININSDKGFNLIAGTDGKLQFKNTLNILSDQATRISATGELHLKSNSNVYHSAQGNNNFTAGGNTNIHSSGQHLETASQIHMNGPAASSTPATKADTPTALSTFKLPNVDKSAGWSNGNFYKVDDLTSIMRRVPTHEPWPHHENIKESDFTPSATDNTKK